MVRAMRSVVYQGTGDGTGIPVSPPTPTPSPFLFLSFFVSTPNLPLPFLSFSSVVLPNPRPFSPSPPSSCPQVTLAALASLTQLTLFLNPRVAHARLRVFPQNQSIAAT